MSPSVIAAILIIGGYLYGITLYEPLYFMVQRALISLGVLKMPENAPEGTRLLGNQVQIVMTAIIFIGIGIWLFIFGDN